MFYFGINPLQINGDVFMKNKLLAAVFASTLAASALVGVAPASASAPVISTEITISVGAEAIQLAVDGTNFKNVMQPYQAGDFTVNLGDTGLRLTDIFGISATRVNVNLDGTAAAGTITITANASAFNPTASGPSNSLSITVGATQGPAILTQPTLSLNGSSLVVGHGTWAVSGGEQVQHILRACKGPQAQEPVPAKNSDRETVQCVFLRLTPGFGPQNIPADTYDLRNLVLGLAGPTPITFLTAGGDLNGHDYNHVFLRSSVTDNTNVWDVYTATEEFASQQAGGATQGTSTSDVVRAAPFTGPVLNTPAIGAAVAGGKLVISGSNLGGVSKVEVGGFDAQVVVLSDGSIEINVPRGLAAGVYDIVITSDAGRVTVQGGLTVRAGSAAGVAGEPRPSTKMIAANTVKVWVFEAYGAGKVQILLNGQEVAWVNATDADDPKLRDGYLVRTLTLAAGKNVIEVFVDGERVSRRVATGS
jgi:hypothetical protein